MTIFNIASSPWAQQLKFSIYVIAILFFIVSFIYFKSNYTNPFKYIKVTTITYLIIAVLLNLLPMIFFNYKSAFIIIIVESIIFWGLYLYNIIKQMKLFAHILAIIAIEQKTLDYDEDLPLSEDDIENIAKQPMAFPYMRLVTFLVLSISPVWMLFGILTWLWN